MNTSILTIVIATIANINWYVDSVVPCYNDNINNDEICYYNDPDVTWDDIKEMRHQRRLVDNANEVLSSFAPKDIFAMNDKQLRRYHKELCKIEKQIAIIKTVYLLYQTTKENNDCYIFHLDKKLVADSQDYIANGRQLFLDTDFEELSLTCDENGTSLIEHYLYD